MKRFLSILVIWLGLFLPSAFAADSAPPATAGQVKLDLLKQLENDGYLSSKLALEAKERYVAPQDVAVPLSDKTAATKAELSFWERYVSWAMFFKVLAVICVLVAFSGFIFKIGAGLIVIIAMVPKEVYQATMLSATMLGTLRPDLLWQSQAFYIALFSAFANIMLLAWIVESHLRLQEFLKKFFNLGLPPASVVSFWGMLYFGALALAYQSQTFGFFAAVALSGILSFGLYYRPGVLTLHFNEKATNAVIFGHLLVLALYAGLTIGGALPQEVALFRVGLEYYCTIAMGVGFLVAASPFGGRRAALSYLLLFALVTVAAVTGYFFFDLKVIGSILSCIAVLLALEWVGYIGYQAGFLWGTFLTGISLYGGSLMLERFAHLVVLRLA